MSHIVRSPFGLLLSLLLVLDAAYADAMLAAARRFPANNDVAVLAAEAVMAKAVHGSGTAFDGTGMWIWYVSKSSDGTTWTRASSSGRSRRRFATPASRSRCTATRCATLSLPTCWSR